MQSTTSRSPALVVSLFAAVVLHTAVALGFLRLDGARAAAPEVSGAFTVVVLPEAPARQAPQLPAESKPEPQPSADPVPQPAPVPEPLPEPKPVPETKPHRSPKQKSPRRPKAAGLQQAARKPASALAVAVQAPGPTETDSPALSHADYLDNPRPHYPRQARKLRQEGRVLIEVRVSADGRPLNVALKSSTGFDLLDKAALEAVQRWRFVPARRGGRPVEASVIVPIQFVLSEEQ